MPDETYSQWEREPPTIFSQWVWMGIHTRSYPHQLSQLNEGQHFSILFQIQILCFVVVALWFWLLKLGEISTRPPAHLNQLQGEARGRLLVPQNWVP